MTHQVESLLKFQLVLFTIVPLMLMVLYSAGAGMGMVKAVHLQISKLGTVLSNTITTNQTPDQNISPQFGLLDYICDQQHSTTVVS